MLLVVTVSMFRPDFVLNRFYPEYTNFNQDFKNQVFYEEQRKIRLHITRYTDYGERYKMFAFMIEPKSKTSVLELTGLELNKNENENFEVVNLTFMGSGEEKGIQFYDEITRIEISTLDRPKKEYTYLFGLLILMLTVFSQYKKLKNKI